MNIEKSLIAIVKAMKVTFTVNNRIISPEEICKDTGLLPGIARRADQLCALCLGYGIGLSFDEAEKSLLGVRVVFDDVTPNILRFMCITDVIFEMINSAPSRDSVPLDELMYD